MSDDPHHGATKIHASKGGGAGKWLLGGLAAVVLATGGYFAWKNTQPSGQTDLETAYNDTYEADQVRAGPLPSSDDDLTADAASDDSAPPAATASQRRAASSTPRTTPARTEAVPEETLGVMPVSASSDDVATIQGSDDIVVTAPPRPVWTRTPSARRLSAFYPDQAMRRGREGEASLHCIVQDGGQLDCAKVSETPGGGFGAAALRVSRSLRHASTLRDGRDAIGTPVNLRVVFRLEDERHG